MHEEKVLERTWKGSVGYRVRSARLANYLSLSLASYAQVRCHLSPQPRSQNLGTDK